MKILILTPAAFPALTGNAITTERWRRSLTERGVTVQVLSASDLDSYALFVQLQTFHPDVIHVYHAFKSGSLLLNSPFSGRWDFPPLIVSPGGTDINHDLEDPERRTTIVRVLRLASLIVPQSLEIAQSLGREMPELDGKIVTIPKATIWFGEDPYDLRNITNCAREDILFFLPAGIRTVKRNLECLMALEQAYQKRRNIRFVAAGPAIDADYAARFEREVNRLGTFAHWIQSVPPASMKSAYESSDIVLNASLSEGLSNSLLEALAAGRPFLASDIPGNRQTVLWEKTDFQAGLLFDPFDPKDFVRKAVNLVDDASLRKSLGDMARVRFRTLPNPEDEAEGLLAAYRSALAKGDTRYH
jgi:glycosyltransferase involved in cell wall biosynthesis